MDINEYNEKLQSGYFDKKIAQEKEIEKVNIDKLNKMKVSKEFEQTDYNKTLCWLKSLSFFEKEYLKEKVTARGVHITYGCEFGFNFNPDTLKLEEVWDY